MQVIAAAATKAGSNDPVKAAASVVAASPIKTALGDLAYDAKGDNARPDFVIYTWTKQADGTFTYIQNQ
jgi:branched-chain amino acid transport system substrate-binding protein